MAVALISRVLLWQFNSGNRPKHIETLPCDAETTWSPAEIAATGVPCLAAGYSPDIAPALPGRTTQKACGRNFCRGSDSSPNSDVSVEKKGLVGRFLSKTQFQNV